MHYDDVNVFISKIVIPLFCIAFHANEIMTAVSIVRADPLVE